MPEITWTGLAQCQRCQKTAEISVVEAVPEPGSGTPLDVLITFDKPVGWPSLLYCSRKCQLKAQLTWAVSEKERLEQELEDEE